MTMKKIQAIRGMNDLLPDDSAFWQQIENQIKSLFNSYGYKEIRTPVLESTGLFQRAVGEVTDIVEKEMYTFNTKGDESITLRPELTAGCVRMGIEHGLFHNQEQRLWYYGPAFRYERPQKGRYRQFHQFGVEVFGLSNAEIDAELILLTSRLWKMLGIQEHVSLQLNTIGSLESRAEYKKALVQFLESHQEQLDEDCKRRMYTNPLRTLDSKNPEIQTLLNSAPKLMDYLDEESKAHFNELCKILDSNGIQYQVNARLVRGLDYYNRTVFEWVTESLGAQGTVCGGGRYDGLVEQLGGKPTPGIGFAIGIERLMLLIETVNPSSKKDPTLDIYMISTDATTAEGLTATQQAQKVAEMIRDVTPATIFTDYASSNLKKQISKANKLNAHLVIIIAESELNHHTVTLKNLLTEEQEEIAISEIAQVCSSHLLRKKNG